MTFKSCERDLDWVDVRKCFFFFSCQRETFKEVCGVSLEDLMGGVSEGKGVCGVGSLSAGRTQRMSCPRVAAVSVSGAEYR